MGPGGDAAPKGRREGERKGAGERAVSRILWSRFRETAAIYLGAPVAG